MLCQLIRALLKMPTHLIRALLNIKAGAAFKMTSMKARLAARAGVHLYIYMYVTFFSKFSVYFMDFRFYFGGLWISETLGPGPGAADPLHTQQ